MGGGQAGTGSGGSGLRRIRQIVGSSSTSGVHRAAPEVMKTRSLRNHHRLMGIHSRLTKYDTPATRELDERVRGLVA